MTNNTYFASRVEDLQIWTRLINLDGGSITCKEDKYLITNWQADYLSAKWNFHLFIFYFTVKPKYIIDYSENILDFLDGWCERRNNRGFYVSFELKNQSFQLFYTIKQESTVMMCCISTSETCLPKKSCAKMWAIESALSCLPFSLQAFCIFLQQNHMLICISTTTTNMYRKYSD